MNYLYHQEISLVNRILQNKRNKFQNSNHNGLVVSCINSVHCWEENGFKFFHHANQKAHVELQNDQAQY